MESVREEGRRGASAVGWRFIFSKIIINLEISVTEKSGLKSDL